MIGLAVTFAGANASNERSGGKRPSPASFTREENMKKLIAILTLLLCLSSLPALAQEEIEVPPIQIRLSMRVIRLIHESNGAIKLETIGTPVIMTLNRQTA